MDVSGSYTSTHRGNLYVGSFLDWMTNLADAFAVKDKTTQSVVILLVNKILPGFSVHL